ncbi:MAG: hypothetical protein EXR75_16905 [Myxococcales bacterium]|nr:hypothetical protein [Myxococcales bacterium]
MNTLEVMVYMRCCSTLGRVAHQSVAATKMHARSPSWGHAVLRVGALAMVVAIAVAVVAHAASGATTEIPWPGSVRPSATSVQKALADATELFERERAEEFLEASEKGEDSEHIFVMQEDIDAGKFNAEQLFLRGDSAFEHEFRLENGYGDDGIDTHMQRVHFGARGGRDTFSCAGCHSLGGVNGAGTAAANSFYAGDGVRLSSAVVRNPPNVLGLGYVQLLGVEMSAELAWLQKSAVNAAAAGGADVTIELVTNGVRFGVLVARADGSVDASGVVGVDRDLVVKPFGWKGHTARLRRFAERAARTHFGIQAHTLALEHRRDPDPVRLGHGHKWFDPDGDGVARELEEGTLTAMAIYMALLEVPVIVAPSEPWLLARFSEGSALFDRIGCSDCHRRTLAVSTQRWREESDSSSTAGFEIDLLEDGEAPRAPTGIIPLFSDLKRHRMGERLADKNDDPDGIGRDVFITRPLWGVAETPPYLHDGRAATLREAILEHGGEAETARATFEGLTEPEQRSLLVFLSSLSRTPKPRFER